MATENLAELSLELGRLMTEMKYHLRQQLQSKLKEHSLDISFELLEVMSFLWKKDGMNQQELADMAVRDKSSMTYLIDNLVKRNLVERMEDETDRRSKRVLLTKEGKLLQKKLHPWVIEAYTQASAGLARADIQKAISLVKNMTANIKKQVTIQ